jgi:membrane-bound inhibitor of C-type lysozyme
MAQEDTNAGGVWLTIGIIAVVVAGFLVWQYFAGSRQETAIAEVSYTCDQGKTIDATIYQNSAKVVLSDGRTMMLPQTVSADGTRYANKDESFVFWSKGNTAFVTEGDPNNPTYNNCVSTSVPQGGGQESFDTYASTTLGISLTYPQEYAVDESYVYQELGPGKDIHGVKFVIPESMATGTNLADDSYISVEELPKLTSSQSCTANRFLDLANGGKPQNITENGTTYSVASSTGAGAGNRYEEWVYAIPGTKPCTAVRYFIHYGVIDNYPQGTVKQFDHDALVAQFDQIRQSLQLTGTTTQ